MVRAYVLLAMAAHLSALGLAVLRYDWPHVFVLVALSSVQAGLCILLWSVRK